MIDLKSFIESFVFVCGFAGVTSLLGLFPVRYARELYDSSRPSFSLVDLFALGVIQVCCVGYVLSIVPGADDSERLAYAVSIGCVSTFWWFVISTRLACSGLVPLARGAYLAFFVMAAFSCPFIVAVSIVEIILPFDERPGLEYEADVVRAMIAFALYVSCFPMNRWLMKRFQTSEPSDIEIVTNDPA